jgi:hypothetical protein
VGTWQILPIDKIKEESKGKGKQAKQDKRFVSLLLQLSFFFFLLFLFFASGSAFCLVDYF